MLVRKAITAHKQKEQALGSTSNVSLKTTLKRNLMPRMTVHQRRGRVH